MSSAWSKEVFSRNLRMYIERSGKSQREIAEDIGVSSGTINEWATGKKFPRIDKVQKLADYFFILKSDLIEEKQKQPDENDGLSKSQRDLIAFARTLSEDQAAMMLRVMKSIVEDDA